MQVKRCFWRNKTNKLHHYCGILNFVFLLSPPTHSGYIYINFYPKNNYDTTNDNQLMDVYDCMWSLALQMDLITSLHSY